MAEAALEVRGLEVRYGAVPAVRGLDLRVDHGEIVGLIGPNGAGKSTTLHAIMGLVPAHAGEVRLSGHALRGRTPDAVARSGVTLVPEGRRIFGDFTVEENLRLGLAAGRDGEGGLEAVYGLFPVLREFRRSDDPPGRATRTANGRLRRPHARARERRASHDPRALRRGRHAADDRGVPRMIIAALGAQTLVDAVGLGAVYALMAVGIGLVFG